MTINGSLLTSFGGASPADVEEALHSAWEAFAVYRQTDLETRAGFLEAIASEIEAAGDELIIAPVPRQGCLGDVLKASAPARPASFSYLQMKSVTAGSRSCASTRVIGRVSRRRSPTFD